MNWRLWGRGLIAAIVSGGSNAAFLMAADHDHFNLFHGGFSPLVEVAAGAALVGALLYLKEHPDPWDNYVKNGGGR